MVQWNPAYENTELRIPADSDFFFIHSNGSVISVVEAYKRAKDKPLLTQKYANWSSAAGLQILQDAEKYERRSLSGVKIRVCSIQVSVLLLRIFRVL